jgi:hypothetical protein
MGSCGASPTWSLGRRGAPPPSTAPPPQTPRTVLRSIYTSRTMVARELRGLVTCVGALMLRGGEHRIVVVGDLHWSRWRWQEADERPEADLT